MKKYDFLLRFAVLVAAVMCGFGARAQEAYANYTPNNTTLTFYYDDQRSTRSGTTYDLNTGKNYTDWDEDNTSDNVTKVVLDPSFANARPTTTYGWFRMMQSLQSITGLKYLNTSEVTNMAYMFFGCTILPSLDVSHFNTSKVTDMTGMFFACSYLTSLDLCSFNTSNVTQMGIMFENCNNLLTIYVGDGWSTESVMFASDMFYYCLCLVGGQGTAYSFADPRDHTYARIDGGPSNPGYFTDKGPEAYACYTPTDSTLTFYYDKQRCFRTGSTYDLNEEENQPDWLVDATNVTKAVFDSSFADVRLTSTSKWFSGMGNLKSFTGMNYLNTSEVTDMTWMFSSCGQLTSLDLSSFNTSKVTNMSFMFRGNSNLRTIYAGSGWSTANVEFSIYMFTNCNNLVGGQGTTWNSSNPKDKTYAHIDGGPSDPGYFTDKNASQCGDVDGDNSVAINDVATLIDNLLSGNDSDINVAAADCNQDGKVSIGDVAALIDYLLSGNW